MEEVLKLLKSMQEEMTKKIKANKTMLAEMIARMDARQARMDTDSNAWREEMEASRNAWSKEMMACQEKMEARLQEEKPASVDMTPEVAHGQEVPREDAVEMPVGEPRKRRQNQRRNLATVRHQKKKDQNLDARCRKKEQKRTLRKNGCGRNLVATHRGTTRHVQVARRNFSSTKDMAQEYCESRKDLAATGREETRRAKVARHKGNFGRRNLRKEIATGRNHERGTQRLWAPMKRFWTCQVGRTGPEDLSGGSYVEYQKLDLVEGSTPSEAQKVTE
jgi:hypothetical protein